MMKVSRLNYRIKHTLPLANINMTQQLEPLMIQMMNKPQVMNHNVIKHFWVGYLIM